VKVVPLPGLENLTDAEKNDLKKLSKAIGRESV
jgi:hypothetical protein